MHLDRKTQRAQIQTCTDGDCFGTLKVHDVNRNHHFLTFSPQQTTEMTLTAATHQTLHALIHFSCLGTACSLTLGRMQHLAADRCFLCALLFNQTPSFIAFFYMRSFSCNYCTSDVLDPRVHCSRLEFGPYPSHTWWIWYREFFLNINQIIR